MGDEQKYMLLVKLSHTQLPVTPLSASAALQLPEIEMPPGCPWKPLVEDGRASGSLGPRDDMKNGLLLTSSRTSPVTEGKNSFCHIRATVRFGVYL